MPGTNLVSAKAPHEQVPKKIILVVMAILVIVIAALYAFAHSPPVIPEQVMDLTELETYLNRLVDSGSSPGLMVDRVCSGNYALRNR